MMIAYTTIGVLVDEPAAIPGWLVPPFGLPGIAAAEPGR
jgi:hypothetical protein